FASSSAESAPGQDESRSRRRHDTAATRLAPRSGPRLVPRIETRLRDGGVPDYQSRMHLFRERTLDRCRCTFALLVISSAPGMLGGCSDRGAGATSGRSFPEGFLWGAAVAAFQTEMGGGTASLDTGSDWWVWTHDPKNIADKKVSGDLPEDGPASYERYPDD